MTPFYIKKDRSITNEQVESILQTCCEVMGAKIGYKNLPSRFRDYYFGVNEQGLAICYTYGEEFGKSATLMSLEDFSQHIAQLRKESQVEHPNGVTKVTLTPPSKKHERFDKPYFEDLVKSTYANCGFQYSKEYVAIIGNIENAKLEHFDRFYLAGAQFCTFVSGQIIFKKL